MADIIETKEKVEYTEELKEKVLSRVAEVGVRAAAAEAGVPWQTVTQWKKKKDIQEGKIPEKPAKAASKKKTGAKRKTAASKKAGAKKTVKTEKTAGKAKKTAAKKTTDVKKTNKTGSRNTRTEKKAAASVKNTANTQSKPSALEIQNAVLKAENAELALQIKKLKKALAELM